MCRKYKNSVQIPVRYCVKFLHFEVILRQLPSPKEGNINSNVIIHELLKYRAVIRNTCTMQNLRISTWHQFCTTEAKKGRSITIIPSADVRSLQILLSFGTAVDIFIPCLSPLPIPQYFQEKQDFVS